MRIFQKAKDGGPKSPVDAYFLCEFKGLFSIALLKFNQGTREVFHTHAFDAWTWFLDGNMFERNYNGGMHFYKRGFFPKVTRKEHNHKVHALRDSWCLTLRGPWSDTWTETNKYGETITLTHGRVKV